LYLNSEAGDMHVLLNTVDTPLSELREKELIPGAAALEKFNASLR
jgi:2-oxoglutarate ferredoxin oxidoreductase subunit beta